MFFQCFFYLAQHFQDVELWGHLMEPLYAITANPENLVCADNQDKLVRCPYGFCKLISSDSSSFSRSCVLNNSIPNPYGLILTSKTMSKTDIESSVSYTCNLPMCNNLTMAKHVRSLLEERKFLITTTTTTTTTKGATITTTTKSTGNTEKPKIIIQCGLIFLMTFIFHQ